MSLTKANTQVEHYESRPLLWRSYLYLSLFQVHILIGVAILKGNDIGLKVRI